jgi:hypothetical protein
MSSIRKVSLEDLADDPSRIELLSDTDVKRLLDEAQHVVLPGNLYASLLTRKPAESDKTDGN